MTDRGKSPECEDCLSYVAGLCGDEERRAFERHLPGCDACRQELEDLNLVWEALPAAMEMMEPPASLKQEVMDAVRAADAEAAGGAAARYAPAIQPERTAAADRRPRPAWTLKPAAALFAAAAAAIVLLSVWNVELRREQTLNPLPIERALNVSASNIEQLVALKPASQDAGNSSGVACIIDNGQSRQFVVYVFGASPTEGEEAYQVWLVKDGQRSSAGTFRIGRDSRGIGLLAMPIQGKDLDFDAIGITLEPDDRGSQPRGHKMYGSV
ncbi:anti-sigma factor [Paenibacillus sp. MWE-103]|uniref:Anti-sigma-W factor RsiW n=1 Tax=Paenibacillus artemisiicola TaxID=1172618 RepID=A0ABS3WD04_9BACL|nr:anti-sigma factor [Paenibacillus artemisiicola]MBO7746143.1 anti-sigma factor [Paenibacillus artemisiicola]